MHSYIKIFFGEQLEVFFANKQSPEKLYLDILLKKYQTEKRKYKILEMKELLLEFQK